MLVTQAVPAIAARAVFNGTVHGQTPLFDEGADQLRADSVRLNRSSVNQSEPGHLRAQWRGITCLSLRIAQFLFECRLAPSSTRGSEASTDGVGGSSKPSKWFVPRDREPVFTLPGWIGE